MKRLNFKTDGKSGQHVASNSDYYVVITYTRHGFEVEHTTADEFGSIWYGSTRVVYRNSYHAAVSAAVRMSRRK